MLFRLISRAGFLGSAWSAVLFVNALDIDLPNKPLTKKIQKSIGHNVFHGKLDDIELFERNRGCKLAFVKNFAKNETYNAKEWLNKKLEEQPKYRDFFTSALTEAVKWKGSHCKRGQFLTLEEKSNGNFDIKNFSI